MRERRARAGWCRPLLHRIRYAAPWPVALVEALVLGQVRTSVVLPAPEGLRALEAVKVRTGFAVHETEPADAGRPRPEPAEVSRTFVVLYALSYFGTSLLLIAPLAA